MRHNRLPRGSCIAADPKDITPDEFEAWKEARIQEMTALDDNGCDISTGKPLPTSTLIENMADDEDPEPVAPLRSVEVSVPRPVKPLPNQRDLFSHPDIIPSDSEALLGLMHPACF